MRLQLSEGGDSLARKMFSLVLLMGGTDAQGSPRCIWRDFSSTPGTKGAIPYLLRTGSKAEIVFLASGNRRRHMQVRTQEFDVEQCEWSGADRHTAVCPPRQIQDRTRERLGYAGSIYKCQRAWSVSQEERHYVSRLGQNQITAMQKSELLPE